MSATTSRTEKPIEELSDRALKQRARSAHKTIAKLDSLDPAAVVRDGRTDATLRQLEQAIEVSEQVDAELQRRTRAQDERDREQAPFRVKRWQDREAKAKKAAKIETVLSHVARFAHAELQGERLVGNRLTDSELDELNDLVKRKRALARGAEGAQEFTKTETGRYEALVGQAAGSEYLFERKRRDKAAKAKLGELKEERRVASLPRRPIYAEPGSIELPRSVFQFLTAASNHSGQHWGVTEVGLLATILLSFENRVPIVKSGQFVEESGESVLVCPSEIKLVNRTEGSVHDANGGVNVSASLVVLARNGWLEIERSGGEIRIRLGRRAKELRSPEKRKEG